MHAIANENGFAGYVNECHDNSNNDCSIMPTSGFVYLHRLTKTRFNDEYCLFLNFSRFVSIAICHLNFLLRFCISCAKHCERLSKAIKMAYSSHLNILNWNIMPIMQMSRIRTLQRRNLSHSNRLAAFQQRVLKIQLNGFLRLSFILYDLLPGCVERSSECESSWAFVKWKCKWQKKKSESNVSLI